MRIFIIYIAVFWSLLTSIQANAEEHHIEYKNTAVLRGNPSALLTIPSLHYRLQISNASFGLRIRPLLTVSHFRPGIDVELSPAPFVKITGGYEKGIYFGSSHYFPNADSDWSDSFRARRKGEDNTADFFNLGLQLKYRWDSIIFRNQTKVSHVSFTQKNENFVYDEMLDILLPVVGWAFNNELDFLYVQENDWVWGIRYSISGAFLDAKPLESTHRIGPIVSHVFYSKFGETVDSVSAFILLNWYVQHPFRTGLDSSKLLPYSAVGFTIAGTLL